VTRRLVSLVACAALGVAADATRAADPPPADPSDAATVRVLGHPRPYLRPRRELLTDALRTPDDSAKPWLEWEHATGDWGGLRPEMHERGILLGLDYTAQLFSNVRGGETTRDATHAAGLATFSASLDTQRLGLWKGGTFFAAGDHQDGRGVSREVGSLADIGTLDVGDEHFTQLTEAYYQHNFADDHFAVRFGKDDANDAFVDSELAALYLNGDFAPPSNIPMPTFPDPALGLALFGEPTPWLSLAAGAYGADLGRHENGGAGLFRGRVFAIAELTLHASPLGLPGHYNAGAWLRSVETPDPRDATGTASSPRNYGAYALFDQRLFAPDPGRPDRGLGAWFLLSWAPSDRNLNDLWVGGGLVYTGLLPSRASDQLGFGVSMADLVVAPSGQPNPPAEIVVEGFYAIQLAPWLALQPDLQYVVNPMRGGRNALVVGAGLSIDL